VPQCVEQSGDCMMSGTKNCGSRSHGDAGLSWQDRRDGRRSAPGVGSVRAADAVSGRRLGLAAVLAVRIPAASCRARRPCLC
jgi:hypothetical protein